MEKVRAVSPTFTAETLRTGGLAVLGVVQVNEVPQVRPPLVEALERVLGATRHDLRLVPASQTQAAMGDSTTRFLLLGYQMHGHPELDWFSRAIDSLHAVTRYGVLARVESDVLHYSGRNLPEGDPAIGQVDQVRITGRDARVSVHVYDLTTRAMVFQGTYSGSTEAAARDTLRSPPVPHPVGGQVDVGPREPPMAYPEAPPLARALEPAFVEFARSLPGGPPQKP
jgi:hypothetical protein